MVKIDTTTRRENELLAMIHEKNTLIEQLVAEKNAALAENKTLRDELATLTDKTPAKKAGEK